MMSGDTFGGRYAPQALSLLRIVAALIFLMHGSAKLLGFPEIEMATPPVGSLMWIGGLIELVGGLMLLIGIFSRPVALILSGETAVAYWILNATESTFPLQNGGDAAILYCFVFLLIAAAGPGPWSVDALRASDPEPDVEGYAAPGGERQYSPEDLGDGRL